MGSCHKTLYYQIITMKKKQEKACKKRKMKGFCFLSPLRFRFVAICLGEKINGFDPGSDRY